MIRVCREFGGNPRWLPGRITKIYGSRSFEIELQSGSFYHHHLDSIRSRSGSDKVLQRAEEDSLIDMPTSRPQTLSYETERTASGISEQTTTTRLSQETTKSSPVPQAEPQSNPSTTYSCVTDYQHLLDLQLWSTRLLDLHQVNLKGEECNNYYSLRVD